MKLKLICTLIMATIVVLYSCKEDNDDGGTPKTVPVVTTSAATDVTLNSAKVGGSITDKGNDEITESGVVYSSNVATPTTADNKIKSNVTEGSFTIDLTELSSGTTYHVRAFATNSVGTAYGSVVDFSTGNAGPTVKDLSIDGQIEVLKTVTAKYTYSDAENDPEGETKFQWYVADAADGTGEILIENATSNEFSIDEELEGKFLRVSITPKATKGAIDGVEVKSPYTTAVGSETVTFTYNGVEVTYGTITGATGKKWLDRNLGATRSAQSMDDYQAYGDLFQWGRSADGHQLLTRSGGGNGDVTATTGITSTEEPYETSSDDTPETDKFIIDGSLLGDWRNPQAVVPDESSLWQGATGTNNVCPSGWRLPTRTDWQDEAIASGPDGFTKLKLTYNGYRSKDDGSINDSGAIGNYWASTIRIRPTALYSWTVQIDGTALYEVYQNRASGYAVRCIKD